MRIVDYRSTPEMLSWFRYAGIPIGQFLSLRRIPSLDMQAKGAILRTAPGPAFWLTQPIPLYNPTFNRSFINLMRTTATNLLAEGRILRLAWSGGIDSTAALLALKEVGATQTQVEVYYTDGSVAEYPGLLSFIQQNFTPVHVSQVTPVVSADSLWVTGEGGNQIFLPVSANKFQAMRAKFSVPANELPWEEFFFQQHPGWKESGLAGAHEPFRISEESKTVARALMAQCPFQIVTAEQAQWWRIFALHWQHFYYRMGAGLNQADFVLFAQTHRPFFMTALFQQASMYRMATKTADTTYLMIKKPMKDYINMVFPDQDYYNTKTAQPSPTGVRLGSAPYVRFEDGSVPIDELDFRAKVAA